MKFTIQKAKIVKGETVEISYEKVNEKNEKSHVPGEIFDAPFHPDLPSAFKVMGIHLAIMTGYLKAKDINNEMGKIHVGDYEKAENFNVTSYSYGGEDKKEGIVISGSVKLDNGKAVILNSPFYRIEEKEDSRYPFMDDLLEKLERCDQELRAFINGSKRATDPQGNLFDEKTPVINKAKILPPATDADKLKNKQEWKDGYFTDANGNKVALKEEEFLPFEDQPKTSGIPPADPDAMERIKEAYAEDKPNKPAKAKGGKKKVAQSASNPSGEVNE